MFGKFLIPKMFARGLAEEDDRPEAVNAADSEIKQIYAKWRKLGKI